MIKKIRKFLGCILMKFIQQEIENIVQERIKYNFHLCAISMRNTILNNVEGDYLEFGARTGKSFAIAYKSYKDYRKKFIKSNIHQEESKDELPTEMRFFAFDAWENGFPDVTNECDLVNKPMHWVKGAMAEPESVFWNNLSSFDSNKKLHEKIVTVKGYFENTLTDELKEKHELKKAAVVHFDCDLYESTRIALEYVLNLVDVGTIFIFDDYYRYKGMDDCGQFKAFKDFKDQNKNLNFKEIGVFRGNSVAFICGQARRY